jgi:hypothetical protein
MFGIPGSIRKRVTHARNIFAAGYEFEPGEAAIS